MKGAKDMGINIIYDGVCKLMNANHPTIKYELTVIGEREHLWGDVMITITFNNYMLLHMKTMVKYDNQSLELLYDSIALSVSMKLEYIKKEKLKEFIV